MTREEATKIAYEMGAHPYASGWVIEALIKGSEIGATEQKAIDHSEEHLNWIIKQHYLWSYEMFQCDKNECCTFKEWIDKAMGDRYASNQG